MGAPAGYCRPVNPTDGRISSWAAHTNRGVPSVEPGVDYYCPRGTPVKAAASGRVSDVGDSIGPATGRYVTIDLDDGRRVRYLHLERRHVKVGDRVQWGQHIADSGATGYGEADWSWNVAGTGGAHVHMTLFRNHSYTFGRYATLDPELYMAAQQGGATSSATPEEDDMPIMVKANVNIYVLDKGYIKLCDSTRSVSAGLTAGIRQHNLAGTPQQQTQAFVDLLDLYGIPQQVINGAGHVLNPENGKFEKNGMWSWERANYAKKK